MTPFIPTLILMVTALSVWAIYRAITRHRGVERTLAWIFAIIAFPGLGALAYMLLANPRIKGTRRRKQLTTDTLRLGIPDRPEPSLSSDPATEAMFRLASTLTGLKPSTGNRVELLAGDERAFEIMEESLRGARRSIWAEYYIIRDDTTGCRFLDLLAERARAGVEVRLLYDAFGSIRMNSSRLKSIREGGGRAVPFLPFNPLRRRWSLHLRNHRKLFVVDGNIAFTGGMNVGDEYSGRGRRRGGEWFVDTQAQVEGPAVQDFAQLFAEDWAFATDENLPVASRPRGPAVGSGAVAVVPSGPDQRQNANAFTWFAAIAAAKERCFITTPYFVPDEPILQALVTSAMRGVDVRLMVPKRPDIPLAGLAARSYYPSLVQAGVRILEFIPAVMHSKTMIVDGSWSILGSANLDIRSFWLNFELSVLVEDRALAHHLEERFTDLERSCRVVTMEQILTRTPMDRLVDGTARLLSPLL